MDARLVLSIYGAVVATVVAARQYVVDRASLRIQVLRRTNPERDGFTVSIANRSRRIVVVEWVGTYRWHDSGFLVGELPIIVDIVLPHSLSEGTSVDIFVPQNLALHDHVVVRDNSGRWWPIRWRLFIVVRQWKFRRKVRRRRRNAD